MFEISKQSKMPASLQPDQLNLGNGLESEDLSLRQAIRTIRKRKWVLVGTMIACGALTLLVTIILPSYYSSASTIEILKQQGDLSSSALNSLAGTLGAEDDVKTEIETEVSVLQSDDLGLETIERTHYEDHLREKRGLFSRDLRDPKERGLPLAQARKTREQLLKEFESRLNVTPIQDTRLIQVVFEDQDAGFAANVANVLVEQYIQDRLGRRNMSTVQATSWMTGEIDSLKGQVQQAEQKLIDFQRQSGLIVVPTGGGTSATGQGGSATPGVTSPVLDRLTQMNSNLVAAESNRITQEALFRLAKAGDVDQLTNLASGLQGSTSGTTGSQIELFEGLASLRQQETNLKLQLATALETFGPKNPHLSDLNKQLDVVQGEIQTELKRIVNTTEMNYKVAKEAEDGIRKAYDDEEQQAYKMNDSQIRLAVLQQEADSTRALYEDLYTKLQESKLSEGIQSSNVALISNALPPYKAAHPKRLLDAALGLLAGTVLGIICVFVLDSLDDSVTSSLEAERISGIPVLAVIPLFEAGTNPLTGIPLPGIHKKGLESSKTFRSNAIASEAFRAFRTTILLSQAGSPPRTVMVASALPGEGKTTTCYGLGACFAILGNRVLLIDADLRRPSIHKHANVPNDKGLSNLLTSDISPNDVVVEDPNVHNLCIVPAGTIPPNPSELLGSSVFDKLLADFAKQFDIVVIDTPPAMVVADATIISVKVEGTVLVLRSGSTTRSALQRLTEGFRRNKANLLGSVLNAVNVQSPEYYYDHGYYGREYPSDEKDQKQS
jgi:succinoglycan biosynthesis transport protein ExoP